LRAGQRLYLVACIQQTAPDHLIFIRLVNADDSRTPSKRFRCARFRVTPERPSSELLCVLQFASTYRFRRVMIARTKGRLRCMCLTVFQKKYS